MSLIDFSDSQNNRKRETVGKKKNSYIFQDKTALCPMMEIFKSCKDPEFL